MSTPKFITLTIAKNGHAGRRRRIQANAIIGYEGDAGKGAWVETVNEHGEEAFQVAETPEEIDALLAGQQPNNRAALDALVAKGRDLAMLGRLDDALEVAEQIDRIGAGQQPASMVDALTAENWPEGRSPGAAAREMVRELRCINSDSRAADLLNALLSEINSARTANEHLRSELAGQQPQPDALSQAMQDVLAERRRQDQQPASLIADVAANIRHDLDLIAGELAKVRPVNQAHVLPRDTSHLFALLRYIEQEVERLELAQQPAGGVPADVLRDAMRYRWLRQRDLDTIDQGGVFAGLTPRNVVLNEEDLDREVDARMEAEGLSAAPTPPAAEGWRPFSECPKDGKIWPVYRPDQGVFAAHWVGGIEDEEDWYSTEGDNLTGDTVPTLYYALPAPPTAGEG